MCSPADSLEWMWGGTVVLSAAIWLLPLLTNTETYWQSNGTAFIVLVGDGSTKWKVKADQADVPLCWGEIIHSQRAGPLQPLRFFWSRRRVESEQPRALFYYTSWTKAGARCHWCKGKGRGMQVEGGLMGRWALAAREPHPDTGVIIINSSFLESKQIIIFM